MSGPEQKPRLSGALGPDDGTRTYDLRPGKVTAAGDGARRTVTLPPPETRDEPRACLSLVIGRRLAMSGLMLLGW